MTKDTEALREAVEQVKQLAQRDMARTQTDFLGRMGQELCDFEAAIEPYPDGELPDDVRGDAYDAISGLAGLAFAQMLMLRGCDHTIFATPASDVVAGGEALREVAAKYADMGIDERAEAMADNCDGDPWELIGYFREKLRQSQARVDAANNAATGFAKKLAALKGPAA